MDQDRLLKQFCRLVSIDAPSLKERRMADYLKAELEELGFEVEEDGAGDALGGDSGNLYAVLKGTKKSSPLLFSLHMDTVFPAEGKQAVIHEDAPFYDSTQVLQHFSVESDRHSLLRTDRIHFSVSYRFREFEYSISNPYLQLIVPADKRPPNK